LRGHRENCTLWPDYSVGAVGSDLRALIRSLDAGPAVIIDTSMTACVAVWAAAKAPELIAGQMLVAPFVRGKTPWHILFHALRPAMWLRYYLTLYPATNRPS